MVAFLENFDSKLNSVGLHNYTNWGRICKFIVIENSGVSYTASFAPFPSGFGPLHDSSLCL
jgi:hypothetical protein